MSNERLLIEEAKSSEKGKQKLLEEYDLVFRVCALRFCDENNFEDFVQEGIVSLLEKSIFQFNEDEKFLDTVVRNCLRYQQAYYLSNYSEVYEIFDNKEACEKFGLCGSLFGRDDTNFYKCENPMNQEETLIFVRSIVDKKQPKIKRVLELLYNLE